MPIDEQIIINKVKQAIKEEIEQINYSEDEIRNIYKKAEKKYKLKQIF